MLQQVRLRADAGGLYGLGLSLRTADSGSARFIMAHMNYCMVSLPRADAAFVSPRLRLLYVLRTGVRHDGSAERHRPSGTDRACGGRWVRKQAC